MRVEFVRRHDHRIDAEGGQPLPRFGFLQRFERLAVKLVDNLAWRPRRQKKSEPDRLLGIGNTGFQGGRHVRQRGGTPGAVHHERNELALPNLRQNKPDRSKKEINPSGLLEVSHGLD